MFNIIKIVEKSQERRMAGEDARTQEYGPKTNEMAPWGWFLWGVWNEPACDWE